MLAKVYSAALVGLDAQPIEVEIDLSAGLHIFQIVGLPDAAVKESRERVASAIKNSGLVPPQKSRKRVIVNLAPADLKKQGPAYDLPIAVAFLLANNQLNIENSEDKLFIGELSLQGRLRQVSGVLAVALMAKKQKFRTLFVPKANALEAALIQGLKVIPIDSLGQLIAHLRKEQLIPARPPTRLTQFYQTKQSLTDMAYIKGQEQAKRALEIAAAGGHNILLRQYLYQPKI